MQRSLSVQGSKTDETLIERERSPENDAYITPVLQSLESPLFEKLDTTKEIGLENLVDNLIEENPTVPEVQQGQGSESSYF